MNAEEKHLTPTAFRVSAVRHLAWMSRAPQLLDSDMSFHPARHLPERFMRTLQQWDAHPQEGPAVLTAAPNPRLGLYFESLYECLMRDLLGWQVLARNLQIRSAGETLGELDFVLRNPETGCVEHHEVAVKFYLGYNSLEAGITLWHGPNAIDRLDLKTRSLLEQQSQRTQLAETADALSALGIEAPVTTRIFMPGYLFYPNEPLLSAPTQAPDNHLRGRWVYLDAVRSVPTNHWVPLRKPHWLGPWVQASAPRPDDAKAALDEIEHSATPRLFAHLAPDPDAGQWIETNRFFVVPAKWPA